MDANQRSFQQIQSLPSSIAQSLDMHIYHLTAHGRPPRAAHLITNTGEFAEEADFFVIPYAELSSGQIKYQTISNSTMHKQPMVKAREIAAREILDYEGIAIEKALGISYTEQPIAACQDAYLEEFIKANSLLLEGELQYPPHSVDTQRIYFPCELGYEFAMQINPASAGNLVCDPEKTAYPGRELIRKVRTNKKSNHINNLLFFP